MKNVSIEPMNVKRIRHEGGSHIEPPLDQTWSERDKLRWHMAVAEHDSGVEVRMTNGSMSCDGRKIRDYYGIRVGNFYGGGSYLQLWDYINGVADGAMSLRSDMQTNA